jgi:CubicO group peptidase (beta-lactamase class C family)
MTNPFKKLLLASALIGVLPLAQQAVLAAGQSQKKLVSPIQIRAERLSALPAFIDGILAQQLIAREVAGATVTIVHNGKIVFSRGYGWQDVSLRIPMDPDRTLIRPGSVSKLITWTALMQLVEKGAVSLDEDVNTYLDFKIPPHEGKPILVRHLLDHRAGFEERGGITVDDPKDYVPLKVWMPKNIPSRVRPPGIESAYSNHGSALAGYIVERVSGMDFEKYVQKNIFQPLRMTRSSFLDPSVASLQHAAKGYKFEAGRFVAKPMEYYQNIAPAGSIFAPSNDMGRFLIAHLQDGRYGKSTILRSATAQAMRRSRSSNTPGFPGWASGFRVYREAAPRILGHGGNTIDFHSLLVLVPEAKLGFFAAYTGGQGSYAARTELGTALIAQLFPTRPSPRWTGASAGPSPEGSWRTNRRDYSKAPDPKRDVKVTRVGAHGININDSGSVTYWEQIAPDTYELVTGTLPGGGYDQVKFFIENGEAKMGLSAYPHAVYRLVK